MAVSGPNQGSSAAEFDDGFLPWVNPSNAVVDNDSYATCALNPPLEIFYSNFLDITGFGTFTGIAAGDSVTSIQVEVACKQSVGDVTLNSFQLLKAGSPVGDVVDPSLTPLTSESYLSDARNVSQYGTTLIGSDLTSGFGVRFQFNTTAGASVVSVDAVRITLTYTPSAAGGHNLLLLGCGA